MADQLPKNQGQDQFRQCVVVDGGGHGDVHGDGGDKGDRAEAQGGALGEDPIDDLIGDNQEDASHQDGEQPQGDDLLGKRQGGTGVIDGRG